MLIQMAVQAHSHLLLPFLQLHEEGMAAVKQSGQLEALGRNLEEAQSSPALAVELMEALADLLSPGFDLRVPLGRALALRSPSMPHADGPVLARWAIGGALASLLMPQLTPTALLDDHASPLLRMGVDERLEVAVKWSLAMDQLQQPAADPLPAFWAANGFEGPSGSRARAMHDILEDINPWRRPLLWKAKVPQDSPLGLISERAAPTILARLYAFRGAAPEGLQECQKALSQLWGRLVPGNPVPSTAAIAFCLLTAARRHPDGETSSALGPEFMEHLQHLVGPQAIRVAFVQLGRTRAVHSLG